MGDGKRVQCEIFVGKKTILTIYTIQILISSESNWNIVVNVFHLKQAVNMEEKLVFLGNQFYFFPR